MTLNPRPQYPSTRSYVLKLHRDAAPERGALAGRLENLTTGQSFEFSSAQELVTCLMRDAAAQTERADDSAL